MLYLVSTPIGNLGDITFRAIEILKSVDLIISEDTRKTSILLKRYEISKPQLAYNNFNEHSMTEKIVERLVNGEDIALVTNAGTPGISDPGYLLIHAALNSEIPVTSIPGANAAVTALIISDLPAHSFTFRGFPPHKSGPRKRFFNQDKDSLHTQIYYESPYRLQVFLKDALDVLGNRKIVIANDLTKKFETLYRGNIEEMIEKFSSETIRGEYTIVIEGKPED
jgi:16S rRNA (cytidine1402-2'-O)-methyltransferase